MARAPARGSLARRTPPARGGRARLVLPLALLALAPPATPGAAALGGGASGAVEQIPRDPLEREVWIRERALAPARHAAELERALAARDWEARWAALDALRRAWLAGQDSGQEAGAAWRRAAAAALADPRAGVRAAALPALAAAGVPPPEASLAALVADPAPEVRLELARALALAPERLSSAPAISLLEDPDPQVRAEAFATLWLGASSGAPPPGDLAAHFASGEELIDALDALARGRADRRWLDALRGRSPDPLRAVAIDLFEIASGGEGQLAPLVPALRHTLAPAGSTAAVREHELALAACERAAPDAEAALALFTLAGEVLARPLGERERPPEQLVELAVAAAGEARAPLLSAGASAPAVLAQQLAQAWHGRVERWPLDPALAWLARPEEEVRLAILHAVAETFGRTGDPGAGELLRRALDDASAQVRNEAFRALCDAPPGSIDAVLLYRHFRALGLEARLAALRELPREVPLPPFRDALLSLWSSGQGRTVGVLELLGALRGDPVVLARLREWIETELVALEQAGPLPEGVEPDGARGRREGELKALVAAVRRCSGEASIDDLARWLARSSPLSVEVAKVCAALLGEFEAGRSRLVRYLDPPAPDRVRIEAALALLGKAGPAERPDIGRSLARRAASVLLERYPTCDAALRSRAMRALAPWPLEGIARVLADVASDPSAEDAERVVAVESLARVPDPLERAQGLDRVVACGEGDVARFALEELGQAGDEAARAVVVARFPPGAEPPELAEELLAARARLGLQVADLLARPLAAWREDLARRLAARGGAAAEFLYRGELAAAEALASRGELAAALGDDARLARLDGRFALELADRALRGGEECAAGRLLAAAEVALAGEGPLGDRERLAFLASMRRLVLAWRAGEWREVDRRARAGLSAWRRGALSSRALEGVLGPRAPERESDPLAWLEATALTARAQAALAAGDVPGARSLAERARRASGASRRAREQLLELERALDGGSAEEDP